MENDHIEEPRHHNDHHAEMQPVHGLRDPRQNHELHQRHQGGARSGNHAGLQLEHIAEHQQTADGEEQSNSRRRGHPEDVTEEAAPYPVSVRFQGEHKARNPDGEHADKSNLRRLQRILQHTDQGKHRQEQRKDILGQIQRRGFDDVIDHPTSLRNDQRHPRKIGIHQNKLCGVRGGLAAGGHSDGDVRVPQRQNVVHAVAGHADGLPLFLEPFDEHSLLLRRDTSEHRVAADRTVNVILRFQCSGVHIILRISDARLLRHIGNRHRIVSRDNLHIHSVFCEILKSGFRAFPDGIDQQNQSQQPDLLRQRLPSGLFPAACKREDTVALFADRLNIFTVTGEIFSQHKLRRAENKIAVLIARAAVFVFRGKSADMEGLSPQTVCEVILKSRHSDIVAALTLRQICDIGAQRLFRIFLCGRFQSCHLHLVLRDGSCFVHAQHIHPRQRLNTAHILNQDVALGKAHGADDHCDAGHHIQTFGDHSQNRRHHGDHAGTEGQTLNGDLLEHQDSADGDDSNADEHYKPIQRFHHLGLVVVLLLPGCLRRQPIDIGMLSDRGETGSAFAGNHKTPRHQLIAGMLFNLVGLSGDQRLIDADTSVLHPRIRRNLIAGSQNDHIVQYQTVGVHLLPASVPNRDTPGHLGEFQVVQRILRADLLVYADAGVGENNQHEGKILE